MYFTFYTDTNAYIEHYKNKAFFDLLKGITPNYTPLDSTTVNKTVVVSNEYAAKYKRYNPIRFSDTTIVTTPFDKSEIEQHYHSFRIPKKTNPKKFRQIDAPDELLKNHQSKLKFIFEYNLKALPHNAAHAYVKNRSTVTAIKVHQRNNSKWFLKLDLKDFFPSHNKEYIIKMLKQVYPFGALNNEEFAIIENQIDYALLNDRLPQGTPLSPLLTNITMVPIDHEITEALNNFDRKHFVYTRYADDLLISCKYNFNPKKVIHIINTIFKKFETPFRINKEKTRYGSSAGRNWNLGIMLNKDNNLTIGHKNNQKFRAKLYDFICNGDSWSREQLQETLGLIAYYTNIEPEYIKYTINKYNKKYSTNIIKNMKKQIANP